MRDGRFLDTRGDLDAERNERADSRGQAQASVQATAQAQMQALVGECEALRRENECMQRMLALATDKSIVGAALLQALAAIAGISLWLADASMKTFYMKATPEGAGTGCAQAMRTGAGAGELWRHGPWVASTPLLDAHDAQVATIATDCADCEGGAMLAQRFLELAVTLFAPRLLDSLGDTVGVLGFDALLRDLRHGSITTEGQIGTRLEQLGVEGGLFVVFIVIDFNIEGAGALQEQVRELRPKLSQIFEGCHMGVADNTMVVLYSCEKRIPGKHPEFDSQQLEQVLAGCDACAAVSVGVHRRSVLPVTLSMATRAVRLMRKLRQDRRETLFYHIDYLDYLLIDLAYLAFFKQYKTDDLVLLTHPDVSTLYRYDSRYNDNLVDVLRCYCLNGMSAAKTATATYMHRNTVTAKLKKIRSLIQDDITDTEVQQRYIMSCKIFRYLDRCTPRGVSSRISTKDFI